MYRSLCRASRFDCKDINGPVLLLQLWAWERMPLLAPIPRTPWFPLACRWVDWTSPSNDYKNWTTRRFRELLDTVDDAVRLPPHLVPADICHDGLCWNATVPLISFECMEWHPMDRVTRQFGMQQGILGVAARDLGGAHNNVLTGPKNLNWIVAHNKWISIWQDRFDHRLTNLNPIITYDANEFYISWYRCQFSNHLLLAAVNTPGEQSVPPHPQSQKHPQQEVCQGLEMSSLTKWTNNSCLSLKRIKLS
ncbi:uncharacterized protein DS421_17g599050 [Arachis hypogaea]|nr:uncharacterized protein DS421_17g599050 [Arachis hypogaea]